MELRSSPFHGCRAAQMRSRLSALNATENPPEKSRLHSADEPDIFRSPVHVDASRIKRACTATLCVYPALAVI